MSPVCITSSPDTTILRSADLSMRMHLYLPVKAYTGGAAMPIVVGKVAVAYFTTATTDFFTSLLKEAFANIE